MREISVAIYERVKYGAKWRRQRVVMPSVKANGALYLKDDRQGSFELSWYEDRGSPRLAYATGSTGLAITVRDSSGRIIIMRFRPANIRLINRR